MPAKRKDLLSDDDSKTVKRTRPASKTHAKQLMDPMTETDMPNIPRRRARKIQISNSLRILERAAISCYNVFGTLESADDH
ncbi:hypothetical protein AAEP93_010591 [Penicillium crustosum]